MAGKKVFRVFELVIKETALSIKFIEAFGLLTQREFISD
jgi:hypothetical protein